MRQVVVDTETTGLDVSQGHRIIEIACVELLNRRKTDSHFHQYINPQREIDDGAYEVHGISNADLRDKPVFADIAAAFMDFIRGAELIIHNAPFDVEFINHELRQLGPEWGQLQDHCSITDTLAMARERHPGQKNNLDALCKRYEIDNSARDLHGALLDAEILAEVYLAMTGGQVRLSLDGLSDTTMGKAEQPRPISTDRSPLKVIRANEVELDAHAERLGAIDKASGGQCVWLKPEQ